MQKKRDWAVPLLTGLVSMVLLFIWADSLIDIDHPYFDAYSLGAMFASSMFIFWMSFERTLVARVICIILTFFYTQRVITLYFVPDNLDYSDHIRFTYENIQWTSCYYLMCVMALFMGLFLNKLFFNKNRQRSSITSKLRSQLNDDYISCLGFRVELERLCIACLLIFIVFSIAKFKLMLGGIGLTGTAYQVEDLLFIRMIGIANALSSFILFSFFYFNTKRSVIRRLSVCAMSLLVLGGVLVTSRGFLLSIVFSYFIFVGLLSQEIPKRLYIIAGIVVFVTIFVVYPAMTMLRHFLILGEVGSYFTLLEHGILSFSYRLGAFDWLNLWLTVPTSDIPSASTSAFWELITLVNKLMPGHVIPQPEMVDLSKFQKFIGRGYGDLNPLFIGGENQGGLATPYLFFGPWGGLIYLMAWSSLLVGLERARVHIMWKFNIMVSYLVSWLMSGGTVIMASTFFFGLVYITLLMVVIRMYKSISQVFSRSTRSLHAHSLKS